MLRVHKFRLMNEAAPAAFRRLARNGPRCWLMVPGRTSARDRLNLHTPAAGVADTFCVQERLDLFRVWSRATVACDTGGAGWQPAQAC